MYNEVLSVFLRYQGVRTVRALKFKRFSEVFTSYKGGVTNLTEILPISAIIIVNIVVRSITNRANYSLRNSFTISPLNRFYILFVTPFIVLKQKVPIMFLKFHNSRQLVSFKLLVFRRMRIIKSPLFKWYIFANKIN